MELEDFGDEVKAISSYTANDGPYEGGTERIITWSGDVLELIMYNDESWYNIVESSSLGVPLDPQENIEIKYGIYKYGRTTGIINDEDVNNAIYDDFEWFDSAEEAMEKGKIAAVYMTDPDYGGYRNSRQLELKFEVIAEEANIGKVAVIRHKARLYADEERTEIVHEIGTGYTKSKYNEEGVIEQVHTPRTNGNSILIVHNKVSITSTTTDLSSNGTPKSSYNVDEGIINFSITPTLTNDRDMSDADSYIDVVTVTTYLPKGFTYKSGTANKQPDSVTVVPETGETVIVWTYENWQVNRAAPGYPEITFQIDIDNTIANNAQKQIRSVIYTDNDFRDEEEYRTSIYGILIANLSSLQVNKSFDKNVVELDEKLISNLEIINYSLVPLSNVRAIEVLPYNGDENGSDFVGVYDIVIGEIPEGMRVYYTNVPVDLLEANAGLSRDDYGRLNPANINFETTTAWTQATAGDKVNGATAIVAVIDSLAAETTTVVNYEIIPNNNEPNSKYVVSANIIATGFPTVLKSNIDIGVVIQRTIEGTVWYDADEDGIMSDSESRASNISVEVIDASTDEIATNVYGEQVTNILTDEEGNYCITGLAKGNYIVRFTMPDNSYVTTKGVGTDSKVNSKVNTDIVDGKVVTDTLTNLSKDNLEEMKNEEYINLGIVNETGKVIVQYLEKQKDDLGNITEVEIAEQEEITGPIGQEFDISDKEKIIEFYQRTEDDYVKTGTFTEEDQIIKIYYERISSGVIVKHILVNNDLTETLLDMEILNGDVGTEYQTSRNEYENYQPNVLRGEPENATGYFTEDPIEVIYYYERIDAGKVTVRYVREQTLENGSTVEIQLISSIVLTGYVGEEFTTSRIDIDTYSRDETKPEPSGTGVFTAEDQEIKYYYTKPASAGVEVQYLTIEHNEDTGEDEEVQLLEPTLLTGYVGDKYETVRKQVDGYRASEPEPTNTNGYMTEEKIIVKYYYEKLPIGQITVIYQDIDGNLMKDENGNEVQPIVTTDDIGSGYYTTARSFTGYSVVEQPENYQGTYTEDPQTILYVYDRNTYNYRIEYYYENLQGGYDIDNNLTVTGKAKYQDIISEYEDKVKTGFYFNYVTGRPLTIGVSEADNAIKVYYDRNTYNYRVEYYYENDDGELKQDLTATEYDTSLYGAEISTVTDKNRPGYYLGSRENYPLVVTENSDSNVIKLNYYKQDAQVIVKYVDIDTQNEISNVSRETVSGKVGQTYDVSDKKKEIDNYRYVSDSENLTGTYVENDNNNTIEVVYYYKKTGTVITKFIEVREEEQKDDNGNIILDENNNPVMQEVEVEIHEQVETVDLVGNIVTVYPIAITNYTLIEGQTSKEVEVIDGELVEKYYYTGVAGGVIERHIDEITGEILEEYIHEGRQGDSYDIDSKTFEGYDLVEDKLPNNSEGTMTEDPIEINYYYLKQAKVIVRYVNEISGEDILVNDQEITVEINGHENDDYTTEKKEIEGYIYTRTDGEESGKMSVKIITNENGEKEFDNVTTVIYYYKRVAGGVIERHIDDITGEIIEENTYTGKEQDPYKTNSKVFTGYDLVEEKLPNNSEGNMTIDPIIVNYYYIKKASVEIKYLDIDTDKELSPTIVINGHENDDYTSEAIEIEYYRLVQSPSNANGKMTAEITKNSDGTITVNNVTEVIYYYEKLQFNFKIDQNITEINLNGQNIGVNDGKLERIDINSHEISNSNAIITYEVKVTNDSEINGSSMIVVDIPDGFEVVESEGWTFENGNLSRMTNEMQPGETVTYTIKLKWEYAKSEVGIKTNLAKISQTFNVPGFEEITLDDNTSETEVIISVSTGRTINRTIIITLGTLVVMALVIMVLKKQKKQKKGKYSKR